MLLIARHGQTDWNREQRYQARTDVPINATGRAQAAAIAAWFTDSGTRFDQAVCSPLGRAVETASIMLADTGVDAVPEPELLEIDLGEWEGRYAADLKRDYGDRYTHWQRDCYPTAAPGGESMGELIARVTPLARRLDEQARGATVLVVAHQATNMALKAALSADHSIEALQRYRQSNNEVDLWDPDRRVFAERHRVDVA